MDMLYYYIYYFISLQKLYAKHCELIQFLLDIQTDFKEKKNCLSDCFPDCLSQILSLLTSRVGAIILYF